MKKLLIIGLLSLFGQSAVWAQKTISIENTTDKNRVEIISIPYAQFSKHFGVDSIFTIKEKHSNAIVTHQLERLGKATVQNILLEVNVSAKSNLALVVTKDAPEKYPSRAYARYIPERFDDFAWENDVVAFRLYGEALEGRADDAQGMDYWAKRTSDLIVDKWYKEDDYHKDHGEGLDYYTVGQTLGAGDIALFYNDKVYYTKHYRQHSVLDNGPLRTTFALSYESQVIEGNTISLTKTITLDAGQHFNKISIQLDNKDSNTTPVVLGLAKRDEHDPAYSYNPEINTLAYWEPEIKTFGQTGTALIVPDNKVEFISNVPKQFLLKTAVKNGKSFVYYNGAAWNRAGKITSATAWTNHVEKFAEQIKTPLKIKLK